MSKFSSSLLESLQLSFLKRTNQDFDIDFYRDFYLKNLDEKFVEAIFEDLKGATKYQDPYTYSVIKGIVKDIVDITEYKGLAPVYGTASFDLFSAEITGLNDEPSIMLVSHGVFIFSDIISKIVSSLLICDLNEKDKGVCLNQKYIQFNLHHNTEATVHFCDIMFSYLLGNSMAVAKQYHVDSETKNLSSILNQIFLTFLVAHEYSHYILGHTYDSSKCKIIADEPAAKQVYRDWLNEYQADLYGVYLCINIFVRAGIQMDFIVLGILLNFKTLEVIEMYGKIFPSLMKDKKAMLKNTHPPVEQRMQMVIEAIASEYNEINSLCSTVDFMFESLWGSALSVIKKIMPDVSQDTFDFSNIQEVLFNS